MNQPCADRVSMKTELAMGSLPWCQTTAALTCLSWWSAVGGLQTDTAARVPCTQIWCHSPSPQPLGCSVQSTGQSVVMCVFATCFKDNNSDRFVCQEQTAVSTCSTETFYNSTRTFLLVTLLIPIFNTNTDKTIDCNFWKVKVVEPSTILEPTMSDMSISHLIQRTSPPHFPTSPSICNMW